MSEHNMTAGEVVAQLRSQVEQKTALTISAGIAPNKMLAKVSAIVCQVDHRYARTKTSQTGNLNSILTA
jgi:nucleotidyltransferase/DNA polymerase involved in DNA repair